MGIGYATPLVLAVTGAASAAVLLTLLTLPLAWPLLRVIRADGDPRRLNPVLKGTARLSMWFSLAFAIGLAVPGFI